MYPLNEWHAVSPYSWINNNAHNEKYKWIKRIKWKTIDLKSVKRQKIGVGSLVIGVKRKFKDRKNAFIFFERGRI